MKNTFLIISMLISMAGMNSCKDKCPEPEADINDLRNCFWVSTDSNITRHPSTGLNVYGRLYLSFDNPDTMFLLVGDSKEIFSKSAWYSYRYFDKDSLNVSYLGPGEIGFVRKYFHNRIILNETKDSMFIENFKNVYPSNLPEYYTKINF